jgi:hypothetical protein
MDSYAFPEEYKSAALSSNQMPPGYQQMNLSGIKPREHWARFRDRIPKYTGSNPSAINYSLIKTTTIRGVPGIEESNINRYIVSRVSLEPEFNTGKKPASSSASDAGYNPSMYSFSQRFFQVIDYHAKIANSFIAADKAEGDKAAAFATAFSSNYPEKPFSLIVDKDASMIPKLVLYDNNKELETLEDIPPVASRTIHYITPREVVHDPASKQSPITAEVALLASESSSSSSASGSSIAIKANGNKMNSLVEVPAIATDEFKTGALDLPTAITYPNSPYLQGNYNTITISQLGLDQKTKKVKTGETTTVVPVSATAVEQVKIIVKGMVINNLEPTIAKGLVEYEGGESNEVANVVAAVKSYVSDPVKFPNPLGVYNHQNAINNMLASKRYGDQLQAYCCKNKGELIRDRTYLNAISLKSVSPSSAREVIVNEDNYYEFKLPTNPTDKRHQDLGHLYMITQDRPLCGYSMLIGINFIFAFIDDTKKTNAYIFTYAGDLQTGKNYVGGKKADSIKHISERRDQPYSPPSNIRTSLSNRRTVNPGRGRPSTAIRVPISIPKSSNKIETLKSITPSIPFSKLAEGSPDYAVINELIDIPIVPGDDRYNYDMRQSILETRQQRILDIIDEIFVNSIKDGPMEDKSFQTHPFFSYYVVLSAYYTNMMVTEVDEEDYQDYIYINRLLIAFSRIFSICEEYKHSSRMTYEQYLVFIYVLGRYISIILLGAMYEMDWMRLVMTGFSGQNEGLSQSIFNGAETVNYFMTTSMYLKQYFDILNIRNISSINADLAKYDTPDMKRLVYPIINELLHTMVYLNVTLVYKTETNVEEIIKINIENIRRQLIAYRQTTNIQALRAIAEPSRGVEVGLAKGRKRRSKTKKAHRRKPQRKTKKNKMRKNKTRKNLKNKKTRKHK